MILYLLVYLIYIFKVDPSTMLVPLEKKGLSLNLNPLKDPLKAPMGY